MKAKFSPKSLIGPTPNINKPTKLYFMFIYSVGLFTVSQFFREESEQAILLVKKLVEYGCNLDAPNLEGERPLYQCACGGNIGMINFS